MNDRALWLNGVQIDYPLLQGFCTIDDIPGQVLYDEKSSKMAAYFLGGLGDALGTVYGYSFGLTLPIMVKDFLKWNGYSDVKRSFDPETRKREVIKALDRGCPVFITSGSSITSFHSWVIDGYRKGRTVINTINSETKEVVSSQDTGEVLFVHCNYGWHGACNGFYTYDVFDTRAGAKEYSEAEEEYQKNRNANGSGTGNGNYHILTNVITFDR